MEDLFKTIEIVYLIGLIIILVIVYNNEIRKINKRKDNE